MSRFHFPFVYFPLPHFFPWRFMGEGGTLFFVGDDPLTLDYRSPIAGVAADATEARLPLTLSAGQPRFIAARNVAASGVVEGNTHVLAAACINEAGELQPLLTAVADLTISQSATGKIAIEFTWNDSLLYASPAGFELLGDGGSSVLNLESPIASQAFAASRQEYRFTVSSSQPSRIFGVRPFLGNQKGPLAFIRLAQAQSVSAAPVVFPSA